MILHTIEEIELVGQKFKDVKVVPGLYQDGSLALMLYLNDGEQLSKVSVNLPDGTPRPATNCVWVKTWSENEGMVEQLVEKGVLTLTGRETDVGPFHVRAIEAALVIPTDVAHEYAAWWMQAFGLADDPRVPEVVPGVLREIGAGR